MHFVRSVGVQRSFSTRGSFRAVRVLGALGLISLAISGCKNDEVKYDPKPAPSGDRAALPPVPNVPKKPIKNGDAYTVWGASYSLRSRVHSKDIDGKEIKLAGYIIKTNLDKAPECAVHETGKEDPEGCIAPVPAFWIADSKDAPEKDAIKVMGWASNFAQLHDAIKEYKKRAGIKQVTEKSEPYMDNFWGVEIPDPIPNVGAKVVVTGTFATTFTKATKALEADPIMGILTYNKIEYQEKPTALATLPGMK